MLCWYRYVGIHKSKSNWCAISEFFVASSLFFLRNKLLYYIIPNISSICNSCQISEPCYMESTNTISGLLSVRWYDGIYHLKGVSTMTYTDQEKTAIVVQHKQWTSAKDLSVKYGVCERTIYRWTKIYQEMNPDKKRTFIDGEYNMLLRRVNKLETSFLFWKQSTVLFLIKCPPKSRTKWKYAVILEPKCLCGIFYFNFHINNKRLMLNFTIAKVNQSGYYYCTAQIIRA